MKRLFTLALTPILFGLLCISNVQAQCQHGFADFGYQQGFEDDYADGRYVSFNCRGKAFLFDRETSAILFKGQKIGLMQPNGQVKLLVNPFAPKLGAPAAGVAVNPAPAGVPVPAVINGAVPPAGGPAPAAGGPVQALQGQAPVVNGPATQPLPPLPPSAPDASTPAIQAPAIQAPAAGQPGVDQVTTLDPNNIELAKIAGAWRTESKDPLGQLTVIEVNLDADGTAKVFLSKQGDEAQEFESKVDFTGGKMLLVDQQIDLGTISSITSDRIVLNRADGSLTQTRSDLN